MRSLRRPPLVFCLALLGPGCGPAAEISGELSSYEQAGQAGDLAEGEPATEVEEPDEVDALPCGEPTLQVLRDRVFQPSCATAQCHVGPAAAADLDLSGLPTTLWTRLRHASTQSPTGMALVQPGETGASYLYLKVFLRQPLIGDAMPPDGRIDECDIELLARWIRGGAMP